MSLPLRHRPKARLSAAFALILSLYAAAAQIPAAVPPRVDPRMERLRYGFRAASERPEALDPAEAAALRDWPEASSRPVAVRAYLAAFIGLRGKYEAGLLGKAALVREAVELYKAFGPAAEGSAEALFLRFSFFEQIPPFFGVAGWPARDFALLLPLLEAAGAPELPAELRRDMAAHILGTRVPRPEERRRLERLLASP